MEEIKVEELETLSPDEKVQKLLEAHKKSLEEFNKLKSDTDRGVQKVLNEKKHLETMKAEYKKLSSDKDYFAELYQNNPELAQDVLNEYFDGMTIEQAIEQLSEDKKQVITKQTDQEKVKKLVQEELTKTKVNETVNGFIEKAKLTEEQKAQFNKEFKELTEGKELSASNIGKYLKIAFNEAFPDNTKEPDTSIAVSYNQSGKSKEVDSVRKSNIEYLKQQGII